MKITLKNVGKVLPDISCGEVGNIKPQIRCQREVNHSGRCWYRNEHGFFCSWRHFPEDCCSAR